MAANLKDSGSHIEIEGVDQYTFDGLERMIIEMDPVKGVKVTFFFNNATEVTMFPGTKLEKLARQDSKALRSGQIETGGGDA